MTIPRINIATTIALAGLLFVSSCSSEKSQQTTESSGISAETSVAQLTSVPRTYHFTGTVEGEQRINLSTKVMGRITSFPFDLGDEVSRGEVLLRVKNDNLVAQRNQVEASLAEAEASLKNTRTNYNRIKALYADSSATQKEMDDIETQLGVAEARLKALQSKLAEIKDLIDYSVIESPIDGYVVQKMVSEGDMASPGQPLLAVEEVNDLKVLASVPASQIQVFSRGDTLELSVGATGEQFRGTVRSINPSADARSRQFEVEIQIPAAVAARETVKPGMFADVTLRKGEESLLVVPEEALVSRGQLTGLYTVNDDNELLLRWVRTGQRLDRKVEILSGVQPGERFVIADDQRLREGQKVNIQ